MIFRRGGGVRPSTIGRFGVASFQEHFYSGVKEGVAAEIAPDFLLIVLLGIEILPHAGGIYMFITLVPSSVDHPGQGWVVGRALERVVRSLHLGGRKRRGRKRGLIIVSNRLSGSRSRRASVIVEEDGAVGSQGLVHDKEQEVVVL